MTQTSTPKFKVGDRVRSIYDEEGADPGKVQHVGNGRCFVVWKDGTGWFEFKHIEHAPANDKVTNRVLPMKRGWRVQLKYTSKRGTIAWVGPNGYAIEWDDGDRNYYDDELDLILPAPGIDHSYTTIADELVDEARAANTWTEQRSGSCLPRKFDVMANDLRRDGWVLRSTQYVARRETDIVFYVFEREVQGCACCGGRVDVEGYCNQCDLPF